ncbi:MAG: alpha/beta hydrolase [Proteobacteria bacterium]|nr:alpha/beta hydrolase [Pseudomonadota bacterium]
MHIRLKARGATLHVESDGNEGLPALLLWPGGSCTTRMWDRVIPDLAERFFVLRFDIRGVGKSSPADDPEAQYTFEQYAEDAIRVLDHFEVDRCHVWSMAWGTRAAIAFCSLYPNRVISAALFEANTGMPDPKAQQEGQKAAREKQRAAGIEPFPLPEGYNAHDTPESVPLAMGALRKFDLAAAVPGLTMPVLIATGDHDPNLTSSREVAATLPNSRLVVFENVGHGSVLQRPDLTSRTFLEFQDALQGTS